MEYDENSKGSKRAYHEAESNFTVSYPGPIKLLYTVALLFVFLLLIMLALVDYSLIDLVFAAFFLLVLLIVIPHLFSFRLDVSDRGIHVHSFWKAIRFISWSEIVQVYWHPTRRALRIRTCGERTLCLNGELHGVEQLMAKLRTERGELIKLKGKDRGSIVSAVFAPVRQRTYLQVLHELFLYGTIIILLALCIVFWSRANYQSMNHRITTKHFAHLQARLDFQEGKERIFIPGESNEIRNTGETEHGLEIWILPSYYNETNWIVAWVFGYASREDYRTSYNKKMWELINQKQEETGEP